VFVGCQARSTRAPTTSGAISAARAATSTLLMPCFMAAPPLQDAGLLLNGPFLARAVAEDKAPEGKGEYEFKLPDFDEDTFIHREMVQFKTTSLLFLWGIVTALVSWAAYALLQGDESSGWLAGLLIAAA